MPEQSPDKLSEGHVRAAHILLTDRDLNLMMALHDHVVLSFIQIHERFFPRRTWATSMNRLRRIESRGLIERTKVPRLRLYARANAAGVVFQLSNEGRKVLAKLTPEMEIFERCPSLNPFQLDHDLLIADIADHFLKRFKGCHWTNGRYLKTTTDLKKIPDAILKKPNDGRVIAIELEFNGKSSRRYRDIVANLKSSRALEKVIFVTANHSIGRKIMSEIDGFQVPIGYNFRSDFFEFVRLDDCVVQERVKQKLKS